MCNHCEWEDFLQDIEDILDGGDCDFAEDTLRGISETVTGMEHCTENQRDAVENIKKSVEGRD